MQHRRLIVQGAELQLGDSTTVGINFQANDWGELKSRQSNYTNTFQVPLTAHNIQKLEQVNVMLSNTDLPYIKATATYIEHGIELVTNGDAYIKKTDQDFIYINIVSGNKDFSQAIGDLIVGDLYDIQNIPDHTWNLTNVLNSRLAQDYYIYPIISWRQFDGVQSQKKNFVFDSNVVTTYANYMLPCIRIPDFFNMLEEYTGLNFVGSYIESDDHKNMVLTPDSFERSVASLEALKNEITTPDDPSPYNTWYEVIEEFVTGGSSYETHNFLVPHFSVLSGSGFDTSYGGGGIYYPSTNETANLRWRGKLYYISDYTQGGGLGLFELPKEVEIWFTFEIKNGATGDVLASYTTDINDGDVFFHNDGHYFVFDIQTGDISLTAGQGYYCNVVLHAEKHPNAESYVDFAFPESYFSIQPTKALTYGNEMRFVDLFRMKTSDVISDILKLRGIVIQTNAYTKEVQFTYIQDLIDNKPNARNWSKKVDIRQNELTFKFGKYGRRNWFRFLASDDVTPEFLGDYYVDLNDETLEPSVDVVQLKHPATMEENGSYGYNVPTLNGIDSQYNWQKPKWRILECRPQNTNFDVEYDDGVSQSTVDTNIPICQFYGFDELAPGNYQVLFDVLDKTKVVGLICLLDATDVQDFDFSIPTYLDVPELDVNGYFYTNLISNYKEGGTLVQFVRL